MLKQSRVIVKNVCMDVIDFIDSSFPDNVKDAMEKHFKVVDVETSSKSDINLKVCKSEELNYTKSTGNTLTNNKMGNMSAMKQDIIWKTKIHPNQILGADVPRQNLLRVALNASVSDFSWCALLCGHQEKNLEMFANLQDFDINEGIGGTKVTTNGQGEFELRGVAADVPLEVHVSAKALCPITVEQTVALGQTKGPIQLTLRPAGRIEITVQTSQLFAAAQARFVGDGADGVAPASAVLRGKKGALEGLQPGTWEVTFMAMGNRNADSAPKQTVNVIAGQTTSVTF